MTTELPEIATPGEVSDYLRVSVEALKALRYRGEGPTFVKVGRNVRYRRADVEAYLAAHTQKTTGAAR